MESYCAPRGTQDILPQDQSYWVHVERVVTEVSGRFGFSRIDTPIFEATEVFLRGVGEGTDVVDKEMYTFSDRGGNSLTLRPEFTAGVVRAYLECGMKVWPQPVKLFSMGPAFRFDRPQAGRFRQFHQFNAEIIGIQDPAADYETMSLAWEIFSSLGFRNLSFQLNSTGCPKCKPAYVQKLASHLQTKISLMGGTDQERVERNPLRILDSKEEGIEKVLEGCPVILDHLCDECEAHFNALRRFLHRMNKPYILNPLLVRGLDYYTKTVYEVWAEGIGAQSAVCGGGRYDGLAEVLGGPHVPGVGFAAGIERAIMVMKAQGMEVPDLPRPAVYVAHFGGETKMKGMEICAVLREAGIGAQFSFGERGIKSQLRDAHRSSCAFAVILGEEEVAEKKATVRNMKEGTQKSVPIENLASHIQKELRR